MLVNFEEEIRVFLRLANITLEKCWKQFSHLHYTQIDSCRSKIKNSGNSFALCIKENMSTKLHFMN